MKPTLLFSLVMYSALLSAQIFGELPNLPPLEGVAEGSVAFADVDSDGDDDLMITGFNSLMKPSTTLYLNDGSGSFTEVMNTPFADTGTGAIAFADVDGDDDPDMVITGVDELSEPSTALYLNDGTGQFSLMTNTPFLGVEASAVAFADVDGDNDSDILVSGQAANSNPLTKLYLNDGAGNFSEAMTTVFEGVKFGSLSFADIDGDDDSDLVLTGFNSEEEATTRFYLNLGSGAFIEVANFIFEAVAYSSTLFTDVDNDQDKDLFLLGRNSQGNRVTKLYVNNGSGSFTEVLDTPFVGVDFGAASFADVDGDNDQDVLIAGVNNAFGGITKLYLNDGAGNFTELENDFFEQVSFSSIAFADVDGDEDQDVIITGRNNEGDPISKLYFNGVMTSASDLFTVSSFEFMLFPNPVHLEALTIHLTSVVNNTIRINIFDATGRLVDYQYHHLLTTQLSLDISHLNPGIYFIELNDGKKMGSKKIVVQ